MRWDAVERVGCPRGPATDFEGDGVRIKIPWHLLPKEESERGRVLIEKTLGKDFNLVVKPFEEAEPTFLRGGRWHEQAIGLLKLFAFSIVIGAGWMGGFVAILFGELRDRVGLLAALGGAAIALALLSFTPPGVPVLAASAVALAGLHPRFRRTPA